MSEEYFIKEFNSLPQEAQSEVLNLIQFLKLKYEKPPSPQSSKLKSSDHQSYFGMWKDREDMKDSTAWVRKIRQTEWLSSSHKK